MQGNFARVVVRGRSQGSYYCSKLKLCVFNINKYYSNMQNQIMIIYFFPFTDF